MALLILLQSTSPEAVDLSAVGLASQPACTKQHDGMSRHWHSELQFSHLLHCACKKGGSSSLYILQCIYYAMLRLRVCWVCCVCIQTHLRREVLILLERHREETKVDSERQTDPDDNKACKSLHVYTHTVSIKYAWRQMGNGERDLPGTVRRLQ